MHSPRQPYDARYRTLDLWRGIAAFGVVLHHLYSSRHIPALEHFYLFVQLFFVISGYCLAAAAHRALATRMRFGTFMKRRVRRIGPPYVAAVAFALACWFARGWMMGGAPYAVGTLRSPWYVYAQNLTMTQWLTMTWAAVTSHHVVVPWGNDALFCLPFWSLNYEEQFYLLIGAAVALSAAVRPALALAVLTALVAVLNLGTADLYTGLFFDYWLQFAVGLIVYARLCLVRRRGFVVAIDIALGAVLLALFWAARARGDLVFVARTREFFGQLLVCVAFALVLVATRRFDAPITRSLPGRALAWLGAISYSLYLVHYPLIQGFRDPRESLAHAIGNREGDALSLIAIVLVAYGFHRLFERPFLNSADRQPRAASPAASDATTAA